MNQDLFPRDTVQADTRSAVAGALAAAVRLDREWEAKVVSMILRNLSSLFERSIASVAQLNRYRKEPRRLTADHEAA